MNSELHLDSIIHLFREKEARAVWLITKENILRFIFVSVQLNCDFLLKVTVHISDLSVICFKLESLKKVRQGLGIKEFLIKSLAMNRDKTSFKFIMLSRENAFKA